MSPEQVLAKGSRSFHLAAQFLPRSARLDAAMVYTLCRNIDDEADDAQDLAQADRALSSLAQELLGQAPPRPVVADFLAVAQRRGLQVAHALELIEGARTDLGPVLLESEGELIRYAYRVAGTVGLMMTKVIGAVDPAAAPFAIDLGVAMQLTNIARDVQEDASLGRVYLPRTWLAEQGLDPESILEGTVDRFALAQVVRRLLALAERYYASADRGLHFIPLRTRVAIVVASRVYRGIGTLLLARGADPLQGRTVVGPLRRLSTALLALGNLLRPTFHGLLGRTPHRPELHAPIRHLPGADPAGGARPLLAAGG